MTLFRGCTLHPRDYFVTTNLNFSNPLHFLLSPPVPSGYRQSDLSLSLPLAFMYFVLRWEPHKMEIARGSLDICKTLRRPLRMHLGPSPLLRASPLFAARLPFSWAPSSAPYGPGSGFSFISRSQVHPVPVVRLSALSAHLTPQADLTLRSSCLAHPRSPDPLKASAGCSSPLLHPPQAQWNTLTSNPVTKRARYYGNTDAPVQRFSTVCGNRVQNRQ